MVGDVGSGPPSHNGQVLIVIVLIAVTFQKPIPLPPFAHEVGERTIAEKLNAAGYKSHGLRSGSLWG